MAPFRLFVGQVCDWVHAAHTGLRAGVVEQEQWGSLPRATNASFVGAELHDDLGVVLSGCLGHSTLLAFGCRPRSYGEGPLLSPVSVSGLAIARHSLSYSSWRRHQMPVSLRPSGARSSYWYRAQRPSIPRS